MSAFPLQSKKVSLIRDARAFAFHTAEGFYQGDAEAAERGRILFDQGYTLYEAIVPEGALYDDLRRDLDRAAAVTGKNMIHDGAAVFVIRALFASGTRPACDKLRSVEPNTCTRCEKKR